jgi:hypothetical protein
MTSRRILLESGFCLLDFGNGNERLAAFNLRMVLPIHSRPTLSPIFVIISDESAFLLLMIVGPTTK